ncbi:MAG TPA: hypothetical protein VLW45_13045 [Pelomicrobium sp.]|nr:hypothetical protein [Pelomicrobium sp.]
MSRWDDVFVAATFAEAGEHDAALAHLHERGAVLAAASAPFLDAGALDCALGLSRRIGAGIEVLVAEADAPEPTAASAVKKRLRQAGVPYRLGTTREALARAAVRFVRDHPHVRMVVVDGREVPPRARGRGEWMQLACPLVVAGANDGN